MGRSQETWNKKEVRVKKEKKRIEKEKKKMDRKANAKEGSSFDDMIAYVDENGVISSTPPDLSKREVIKAEDIEIGIPRRDDTEEYVPHKGIVSFFNDSKGFGFIKDLESQQSIFFHIKGLIDPVKEDNKVTFDVEKGPKGLNAYNIKLDK